jgi:RNA polymerase sigma-B factor
MLRHLMMLDEPSSQYRRQRDVITECCLPLADHIARRSVTAENLSKDLVQVPRMV